MSTVRERTIPCTDCEQWKRDLIEMGFDVASCAPVPGDPGFCKITFQRRGDTVAALSETLAGAEVGETAAALAAATAVPLRTGRAGAAATPAPQPSLIGTQVKTAQAIVNLFETSEVLGDYSRVTLIAGDTGHLTYGRTQTTLGSGNLHLLIARYCANPAARFAARLTPYLKGLEARDTGLDGDLRLHNVLRACADDPVMRETQDAFFEDTYWKPALAEAKRLGIVSPLGAAVVYDAFVHGSWGRMRDRTNDRVGTVAVAGERAWIKAYVEVRHEWLSTHSRDDIRATVYRMEAFERLIDQGFWGLELPLVVRGEEISSATLNATAPGCYDGPQPGTREIAVQTPLVRGLDVRLLQLGLSEAKIDIKADGVYGQTSAKRVREYQAREKLPVNGVADIALISKLTSL